MNWAAAVKQFSAEVSFRSPVAPESLWPLLSDITQMGRWSPECTDGRWLGEASTPLVGKHFRGANRWGPVRWSTTCEIVAVGEGRHLTFDARHWSGATTRWAFELIPDGDGTMLRERFETRDSPSWVLLLDRLAGRPRRLVSSMKTTLQRLSDSAERALP
jgi:Polyketide cyclase / dehydrase and lipid transport